jgi:hypothetical protein
LKQMVLATHNCNDTYGKLPPTVGAFPNNANPQFDPAGNDNWKAPYGPPSHFGTGLYFLLPFIEQDNLYKSPAVNGGPGDPNGPGGVYYASGIGSNYISPHQDGSWWIHDVVKTYQAPGDPSLSADGKGDDGWGLRGSTSYAMNWHVFRGGWGEDWQSGGLSSIPRSIPDGTSNTIFFAERYATCGNPVHGQGSAGYADRIWNEDGQGSGPVTEVWGFGCNLAPAFWVHLPGANTGDGNSMSANWKTVPNYPWSFAVLPQDSPPQVQCDPLRLQSFNAGGIMVGIGDGSVRSVSTSISVVTWGLAIDPKDGQVLGSDW